jgi:ribonuclease PH
MQQEEMISQWPIRSQCAAISAGLVEGEAMLDLCYEEDSIAQADLNFVQADDDGIIEIQATAEQEPFAHESLDELVALCRAGTQQLFAAQREALGLDE